MSGCGAKVTPSVDADAGRDLYFGVSLEWPI